MRSPRHCAVRTVHPPLHPSRISNPLLSVEGPMASAAAARARRHVAPFISPPSDVPPARRHALYGTRLMACYKKQRALLLRPHLLLLVALLLLCAVEKRRRARSTQLRAARAQIHAPCFVLCAIELGLLRLPVLASCLRDVRHCSTNARGRGLGRAWGMLLSRCDHQECHFQLQISTTPGVVVLFPNAGRAHPHAVGQGPTQHRDKTLARCAAGLSPTFEGRGARPACVSARGMPAPACRPTAHGTCTPCSADLA